MMLMTDISRVTTNDAADLAVYTGSHRLPFRPHPERGRARLAHPLAARTRCRGLYIVVTDAHYAVHSIWHKPLGPLIETAGRVKQRDEVQAIVKETVKVRLISGQRQRRAGSGRLVGSRNEIGVIEGM